MASALVVISHYNGYPSDQLITLLDQLQDIPAGRPFRRLVVVNQKYDKPLELPPKHADVEILYRENTGYNLGAWDHGWRVAPPADYYVFLQEECRILRPNWLDAFLKLASKPEVGVVGESLVWGGMSWERVEGFLDNAIYEGIPPGEPEVSFYDGLMQFFESRSIPIGRVGGHLQSLVLCFRREVLEAIDGFMIGETKGDAISCEVAISLKVAAKGLAVRQVAFVPFTYVIHPQWAHMRHYAVLLTWVYRFGPISTVKSLRNSVRALRKRLTGHEDRLGPGGTVEAEPGVVNET